MSYRRLCSSRSCLMFLQFTLSWLIIISVAAFDTYLTVKHSPIMNEVELNPVGALVLRSSGGVPLLVGMKTAGVALALLFSIALWQWEGLRSKVLVSSYAVATLAIGMIGFMSFDAVGRQTRRWAEEEAARKIANSPKMPTPQRQAPTGPVSSWKITPVNPHAAPRDSSLDVQRVQPVSIESVHATSDGKQLLAENTDMHKPSPTDSQSGSGVTGSEKFAL